MFPKRAFITFINERYKDLVDRLIQSIELFSEYPIIVYSYNFEFKHDSKNVFCKKIEDSELSLPVFTNVDLQNGKIGIVDRGDFNTYYTLSRKQTILLDALNNGLEEGIFLDADGLVKENIDESFEYLKDCENYPLVGKGLFEYMMLCGKGNPFTGDTLEMPMMNLLGVYERTMHYVQTNFIVFNKNCKNFFEECVKVSNNKNILSHNLLYAPYHDETIINVILWKYKATKHLPLIHYNLSSFDELIKFYKSNKNETFYMNDSAWHCIPENKNDIKYFHGCKSILELDNCLNYFKKLSNKSSLPKIIKNEQTFKEKNIAIVTLFDNNYSELAKLSVKNKIEYAKQNGYDFVYFDDVIDKTRPPQWSKVKAIEHVLKLGYEWVWWIDIDALIMEFDIMLESIIDENFDMIFTTNKYSYLSNGSSFFKNTQLTFDFLKDCYELELDYLKNININIFDHEQQSMRQLVLNEEKYKCKVKLIDERCCNSFCVTKNEQVLSSYPNWNYDSNIYQPGDFVIQFCGRNFLERLEDFKKYDRCINYEEKTITIIDCYVNTDEKILILKKSISEIKKLGQHILLVAHCTIPPEIIKSVTYFIYDKDNQFNEKNLFLTWNNSYPNYDININVSWPGVLPPIKGHEFPIIKSMRNAFNFVNRLDYKYFYFMEFDNYFDPIEFNKIKKLKSDMIFNKKKYTFFKLITQNKIAYETIFFMGIVSYMTNTLNDYTLVPSTLQEFNNKFTYIYPFSLEHIFADIFGNKKTECLEVDNSFTSFFKSENKNLSSYVEPNAYIMLDQNENFFLVLTNSNKIDIRIVVKFDEKIIYDDVLNSTTLPSFKLINEGNYHISFFSSKKLLKQQTEEFYFKNYNLYKNRGIIVFK